MNLELCALSNNDDSRVEDGSEFEEKQQNSIFTKVTQTFSVNDVVVLSILYMFSSVFQPGFRRLLYGFPENFLNYLIVSYINCNDLHVK